MPPRIPPGNGLPVSFRQFSWGDMAKREWGPLWTVPEYVYEMADGRKFESSDATTTGIYKKT